jgi:hypothetical protein
MGAHICIYTRDEFRIPEFNNEEEVVVCGVMRRTWRGG